MPFTVLPAWSNVNDASRPASVYSNWKSPSTAPTEVVVLSVPLTDFASPAAFATRSNAAATVVGELGAADAEVVVDEAESPPELLPQAASPVTSTAPAAAIAR